MAEPLARTGQESKCIHCRVRIYEYEIPDDENGWESSAGSDFCWTTDNRMHEPT